MGATGIEAAIQRLREHADARARVTHWREIGPKPARFVEMPQDLHPGLRSALEAQGIGALYTHQAEAFRLVRSGRSTVVATPTASGKSLCYHLPVLHEALSNPEARAIYLFPTKALARDQAASIERLLAPIGGARISAQVYDGDTRAEVRRRIRDAGQIVITNPHMLHVGILPNHPRWDGLFRNLRYVVVDEVHHYRGVYGSHLVNVLRRLKRVARFYGSDPILIGASATIGNPGDLARRLFETDVALVDDSGAPAGPRHFCLWNPPLVHEDLNIRGDAAEEARRIGAFLLKMGVQFLVFARSRSRVEVLTRYLKDAAARLAIPPARVAAYRGGYLPDLRRELERGIRSGEIQAVVATNALELGIDIGGLDAVVIVGYPGSVASFYQQAGRAGRRQGPSLVVLVLRSTALDQYLAAHPDYLLDRPIEEAVLDPENLVIKTNHVKCSAFEVPFEAGEAFGGAGGDEIVEFLARDARLLHRSQSTYFWVADAYPAQGVSLNAADVDGFVIQDIESGEIIGETDRPSALTEIHPGAIYGFQGEQFLIERLDYDGRRAYARKVDADYYTQAEVTEEIRPLAIDETADDGPARAHAGDIDVTVLASVYKKVKFYTHENVGAGEIHLPPEQMETQAFWLAISEEAARVAGLWGDPDAPPAGAADGAFRRSGGLVALANLLLGTVPLFIRCDPRDVHVVAEARAKGSGLPTLWVYDAVPGGVGLARRAYALRREIARAMLDIVSRCPCERGCPSCVGAEPRSGRRGKEAARRFLERYCAFAGGSPPALAPAAPAVSAPPLDAEPVGASPAAVAPAADDPLAWEDPF